MGGQSSKKNKSADLEPQLIVVFGATGMQGGSVVRAMKGDDKFKIKAVTRNMDSEKAKALVDEGIEVVCADLDDLESLNAVVEGAHGVFMLTNYYELMNGEKELQQGKNLTDACVEQKVHFLVASLLEDVKAQIGKACDHFDYKARIEEYIKEKGVPFCSVRMAGYMEILLTFLKPRKVEEGQYIIDIPMGDTPMDLVCASECGECIHQIFLNKSKYKNKEVGLGSDKITVTQMAEILTKHLEGKEFKATEMTTEQLEASGEPLSAEFAAMWEFYIKGKFTRDIALTKKLNPKIPDFEKWVADNKEALEQALE